MGIQGIYKRGGLYWFRKDPLTGKRSSSGAKDRKAAEAEYRERERLAKDPAYAASKKETLGVWAAMMVEGKRRNNAKRTAEYYEQKIGHWVRILGEHTPLSEITPRRVRSFIEQRRREGAVDMTITKELTAITETLKLAKHAQCYPFDPRDLRPPDFVAKYEARKRVMTVAEASELMRALPPRRAAHVAFFLATGARLSEAERAQSGDIDWEGGSVFLRGTKTKASERTVPIITFTSPMLQAAEPWMPFMAWTNIQRDLELACKRAGIPKVTPNDLRRTTATWLVEFGVPYDIVARVLGHTSTQMLHRVYGRPRDASVGKIIDAKYMESGSGTDPSQLGSAAAGRSPQNPSKAPVAQRIEQRFPNPLAIAENIGELAEYGDRVTSISPQDAAQTRIGSYRSVTLLLPPVEAARKALEAVGSSEDPETVAEALFEMRRLRGARAGAALLDASRIAASGDADAEERIVEILETVAEDLGGAK